MAFSEGPSSAAPIAFQIHADDNVATLLDSAEPGPFIVRGCGAERTVSALEHIEAGHKIAIAPINAGQAIMKYGVVIGIATAPAGIGAWIHLHNCKSLMDDRSGGFDLHTGRPEDTRYE